MGCDEVKYKFINVKKITDGMIGDENDGFRRGRGCVEMGNGRPNEIVS